MSGLVDVRSKSLAMMWFRRSRL